MINFVPASSSFKIDRSQFFSPHLYEDFGPDYGSENAPQELLVNNTERVSPHKSNFEEISPYIKRIKLRSKVQNYCSKKGIKTPVLKCGKRTLPPYQRNKKTGEISSTPFTGYVDIHAYNKKDENDKDIVKYGYYGIEQCANAHFCPVCASKILAVRREEITHACQHMLKNGYQILFLTHTAPHNKNTDPVAFVQKFNKAEAKKKNSAPWERFKAKYGLSFYIRAMEATVDAPHSKRKSGLHWHSHTILFFKKEKPFSASEVKELEKWLRERWYTSLLKVGLVTEADKKKVIARGTDIQRPWTKLDGQLSEPEKISRLAKYISKSLSFELASHNTKTGRKADRIPHFELLRQVAEGEVEDKENIISKLVKAFYRRSKVYFSPRLKGFCGLKDLSEEDIVHGKRSIEIYSHHPQNDKWLEIAYKGRQGHVIHALNQTKNLDEAVDVVADYFETVASGYNPLTLEELRE